MCGVEVLEGKLEWTGGVSRGETVWIYWLGALMRKNWTRPMRNERLMGSTYIRRLRGERVNRAKVVFNWRMID